jgi:hypothetical protein
MRQAGGGSSIWAMLTSPLHHPRRLAAGALAIVAAAAIATPALAGQSGSPTTLRFYEESTDVTLTGADGKQKPLGPPVAGDVLDASGTVYAGNHRKHARTPSGTDHTRCTFTGPDSGTCQGEVALGGSLILVRSDLASDTFTVWYGTGRYRKATGTGTTKTVSEERNDSDVVVRLTRGG